jgi:SAM-dependent methyltransferase
VAAPEGGFDLVLSADTLYSTSASRRLWQLVREQLRPGGTALIASKSYYFGCGGSVAGFKAMVSASRTGDSAAQRAQETAALVDTWMHQDHWDAAEAVLARIAGAAK